MTWLQRVGVSLLLGTGLSLFAWIVIVIAISLDRVVPATYFFGLAALLVIFLVVGDWLWDELRERG